jgi:hypothetical protein
VGATNLVTQIRFVEWTADGHLRRAALLGLREDKEARTCGGRREAYRSVRSVWPPSSLERNPSERPRDKNRDFGRYGLRFLDSPAAP